MIYQNNLATSDNQQTEIDALNSLLTALNSIYSADNTENTLLGQILTALNGASTALKQDTGNTTLASILSTVATASGQATQATAAKQDTGNTSLASIDAKMGSSSGAITSITRSSSSQVLLAANANRKGLYLYNNTSQPAFVAFAPTASSSAFTLILNSKSGYESPQAAVYRGVISAIFAANGSDSLLITELT